MGDSHQIVLAVIRFNEECKEGNHLLCYFPFGWGQRSCIGMRFELRQINIALVMY